MWENSNLFRTFLQTSTNVSSKILRAIVEMGFIIFLFYSNLLMGEYEKTNQSQDHSLIWSLEDIFTIKNFIIALVSSFIGYIVFEYLRKKFWSFREEVGDLCFPISFNYRFCFFRSNGTMDRMKDEIIFSWNLSLFRIWRGYSFSLVSNYLWLINAILTKNEIVENGKYYRCEWKWS